MKNLTLVIVTFALAFLIVRQWFPRTIVETSVPHIVTKYDTVTTLPRWFQDSLRIWKSRKPTTDTVNLVVTQTVVDTEYVPVNNPPEERPNVWPVLSYHGGDSFGDTAAVSTFDLRSGRLGLSKVFIPGILTDIEADSNATPKLTFAPFPKQKGPTLFQSLKLIGIGFGSCMVYNGIK